MRPITQSDVSLFRSVLDRQGCNMHAILIAQGGKLLHEEYRAPFAADAPHRMYSVTKSFVSLALGCLIGDGKLRADERIVSFFPDKLPREVPDWLAEQTVEDMLRMRTCMGDINWFRPGVTDRLSYYFSQKPVRPAGTLFHYDSTGTYVLGCLAERLSGKGLLAFMKERFLDEIGGFENAQMLAVPDGTPWGDSALLCTPRALLNAALLVRAGGEWNGKQLVPREYVERATKSMLPNCLSGAQGPSACGYGYQFWGSPRGGWGMHGMGGQFALYDPQDDALLVTTADTQYDSLGGFKILQAFQDALLGRYAQISDPEPCARAAQGLASSALEEEISGRDFALRENPMGIRQIRFCFEKDALTLKYENAQGEKELRAGRLRAEYGLFPEYGYSDERGNVHEMNGFRLKCGTSFGWADGGTLQVVSRITDRYLASAVMTFGFRGKDTLGVRMESVAEDFLGAYRGWAGGSAV